MKTVTPLAVDLNGFFRSVLDVLGEWFPGELTSELAYQKSLETFLRERVPDAILQR